MIISTAPSTPPPQSKKEEITLQTPSFSTSTEEEKTKKENDDDDNDVIHQRLYIGGLKPPILTADMVIKRMKSTLEHENCDILSIEKGKRKSIWGSNSNTDIDDDDGDDFPEHGPAYFFLTVQQQKNKNTSTPTMMTPLQLLTKQYHNVKWKGCKIQVEVAKLHFLQRLEIEREEESRKVQQQARQSLVSTNDEEHNQEESASIMSIQDNNNNNEKSNDQMNNVIKEEETSSNKKKGIKRHLRIRQQHGQEAYMVDTKPIETDNWKDLHFTLKKQRSKHKKHSDALIAIRSKVGGKQQQNNNNNNNRTKSAGELEYEELKMKEQMGVMSLRSKVFLNRAVHFYFNQDDEEMDESMDSLDEIKKQEDLEEDDTSSSSTSSSVKSASVEDSVGSDKPSEKDGYVWSDESDDDDDDVGDDSEIFTSEKEKEATSSPIGEAGLSMTEKKEALISDDDTVSSEESTEPPKEIRKNERDSELQTRSEEEEVQSSDEANLSLVKEEEVQHDDKSHTVEMEDISSTYLKEIKSIIFEPEKDKTANISTIATKDDKSEHDKNNLQEQNENNPPSDVLEDNPILNIDEKEDKEDKENDSTSGGNKAVDERKVSTKEEGNDNTKKSPNDQSEGYVWSDSDDDDDDDDNSSSDDDDSSQSSSSDSDDSYSKKPSIRANNPLDEFSSEIGDDINLVPAKQGDNNEDDDDDDDDVSMYSDADKCSDDICLEEDVQTNINVLAQLFPDLKGIEPKRVSSDNDPSVDGDGASKVTTTSQRPGWDASGLIQRYDPTADTAMKFELKKKETTSVVNDSKGEEDDPIVTSNDKEEANEEELEEEGRHFDEKGSQQNNQDKVRSKEKPPPPPSTDQAQIYEQNKLEGIFQQKRMGGGVTGFKFGDFLNNNNSEGDVPTSKSSNAEVTDKGLSSASESFQFSFQVSPENEVASKSQKSNVHVETSSSIQQEQNEATSSDGKKLDQLLDKQRNEVDSNQESDHFQLRSSFTFSKNILDQYEKNFFDLNEGVGSILKRGETNSENSLQEKWDEERKVLTTDWKRKQKSAAAKKNKRQKFK